MASQTNPPPPSVDTGEQSQHNGHLDGRRHADRSSLTPPGVRSSRTNTILHKPYETRHSRGQINDSCLRYEPLNGGAVDQDNPCPVWNLVTRDTNTGSTDSQLPVSHRESSPQETNSSSSTTECRESVSEEEEEEVMDEEAEETGVRLDGQELDRSDVDSPAGNREEERGFGRVHSPNQNKSKSNRLKSFICLSVLSIYFVFILYMFHLFIYLSGLSVHIFFCLFFYLFVSFICLSAYLFVWVIRR